MPTYFAMTVDTEEEWEWGAGWPITDLSVTNVRALPHFQSLCSRHGIRTTYFANQAVLDSSEAGEIVGELARRRDVEIGMHIHPWNTPPICGPSPVAVAHTFLHNLPPESIRAKLENVYGCFARRGLKPTSFRGGRYSSGGVIHEFLRERAFVADSSVLPFSTWDDQGAPDYRERDLLPVRIAPRSSGELPLWEIPLTLAFTRRPFGFWARCYDLVQHSWLSKLPLIGLAERLGIVRKVWLNFEDPLGEKMLDLLGILRKLRPPCICFTIHSSSLASGKGPYTRVKADEERVFAQMDEVFGTVRSWPEFQPATMTEIAREMEARQHASPGNQPTR
jgi:hypothetical protein